jgi:hypothetical protein
MSCFAGPEVSNDGLVLCLDAANRKSYPGTSNVWYEVTKALSSNGSCLLYDNPVTYISGEPTTNIMYDSNGGFLGTIGNLTGQFTVQTIEANNKYRATCTANGTMRILIPNGVLVNGQTYSISFKYSIVSGPTPYIYINDFVDSGVPNNAITVDFGSYRYVSFTDSRATYDSTYRFFDTSTFTANTVFDLWDIQVEQKDYSTVFVNGTRSVATANVDLPGDYTFPYSNEAGGCFEFDGVADRVLNYTPLVASANPITGTGTGTFSNNKTMSICFKTGYDITKGQLIHHVGANLRGYNFYIKDGNLYAGAWNNTTVDTGTAWPGSWISYSLQTNTWYDVTFVQRDTSSVLTADKLELYVNGQLVGKTNGMNVYNTAAIVLFAGTAYNLSLSQEGTIPTFHFNFIGKIACYKHYTRALSAIEIQQNFNALRGRFGI